jgi:ribosomal protein S18 acetylase RimI-like enzyme
VSTFDATLLSRIEDASLNASAPRQQRWLDGWLVRYAPDKAKRARSIHAVAPGRLSTAEKLALCTPLFRSAGLPVCVRVTPFSQPPSLDAELDHLGFARIDATCVMVGARIAAPAAVSENRVEPLLHAAYVELVGDFQATPASACRAHLERLQQSAVEYASFALRVEGAERPVACGQIAVEGDIAGIYGVHTAGAWRRKGLARRLCERLVAEAQARGATTLYLQVGAGNAAARGLYERLGFEEAYRYHYRIESPAPARGAPA